MKPLEWFFWEHGWWVRVFGWGVWVSTDTSKPLLFSERHGFTKVFQIGKVKIKFLDRRKR